MIMKSFRKIVVERCCDCPYCGMPTIFAQAFEGYTSYGSTRSVYACMLVQRYFRDWEVAKQLVGVADWCPLGGVNDNA